MRDTRAGRSPKHPELFVPACSREHVKTRAPLLMLQRQRPKTSYLLPREDPALIVQDSAEPETELLPPA